MGHTILSTVSVDEMGHTIILSRKSLVAKAALVALAVAGCIGVEPAPGEVTNRDLGWRADAGEPDAQRKSEARRIDAGPDPATVAGDGGIPIWFLQSMMELHASYTGPLVAEGVDLTADYSIAPRV